MDLRAPRTFEGGWHEAHELANAGPEPILVPVRPYSDDRGWSLMNLFAGAMSERGQVNFSVQYPGAIKAWHRHERQTDFWCCILGNIKTGVYREADDVAWMAVIGEQRPGVLVIPTPLWHGATAVGPTSAGLMYYMTNQFDPANPDEERMPWDAVKGFPWGIRHG